MKAKNTTKLKIEIDIPHTQYFISELKQDEHEYGEMAVYFLFDQDNKITYIGKTENLQLRMRTHYRKVKAGLIRDEVVICRIDRDLLVKLETALIKYFKPEHNRGYAEKWDTYGS